MHLPENCQKNKIVNLFQLTRKMKIDLKIIEKNFGKMKIFLEKFYA